MGAGRQFRIRQQRGISLTSIIFLLVIAGSLLLLAMRVVPAFVEYQSIKNAVAEAKAAGGSPAEMRRAFDKNGLVNDIDSISGKDLEITRENDETQIAYEYERRVDLGDHVSLVLKFSGSTDPHRSGPGTTAVANK